MALHHSPRVPSTGLVLAIDPANFKSYPGANTSVFDLSGNGNTATLTSVTFSTANAGILTTENTGTVQSSFMNFVPGSTSGYNPMYYAETSITIAFRWNSTNTYWERVFDFGRGGNNSATYERNAVIFSRWSSNSTMTFRTHGPVTQFSNDGFAPLSVGQWQVWTICWEAGKQTFYKNGAPYSEYSNAFSLGSHFGAQRGDEQYYLGKSNWSDSGADISYGPFYIHNRILTQAEVLQAYQSIKSRYGF